MGFWRRKRDIPGQCWRCGKSTTELIIVSDRHAVCSECLDRYYERCMICGEYAEKDEIDGNGGICELCYDEEDDEYANAREYSDPHVVPDPSECRRKGSPWMNMVHDRDCSHLCGSNYPAAHCSPRTNSLI